MGLEHFIVRKRPVTVGGLEYVCRGPTVATVHLVLGLFPAEILVARQATTEEVDTRILISEAAGSLAEQGGDRVLRVLETCVEGNLAEAAPHGRRVLAQKCLELCDLDRVIEGLPIPDDVDGAPAESTDESADPLDVDFQSRMVVRLAQGHCSPLDVMTWPYEAFLEALAVMYAEIEEKKPGGGRDAIDPADLAGFTVTDARRPGG